VKDEIQIFKAIIAKSSQVVANPEKNTASMYINASMGNFHISMVMKKARKLVKIPLSNRVVKL
jgi:hypothetical protein